MRIRTYIYLDTDCVATPARNHAAAQNTEAAVLRSVIARGTPSEASHAFNRGTKGRIITHSKFTKETA